MKLFLKTAWPVLVLSLVGCGRNRPSSMATGEQPRIESKLEAQSNDPFRGVGEYVSNSCFGSLESGASGPLALPEAQLQTTYFEKPYDPSRLAIVGRLSPRATMDVISDDGASLFAAPLRAGACALFSVLPEIHDDLWMVWSPANVGVGRTLLGLFLPLSRVSASGYSQPVIVVRADTDRYTLVHEYMHFVFDRARHLAGQGDLDGYAEAKRRLARLKSLLPYTAADEGNPQRVGALLDAWSDLADALITVTDQFPLEEMAVEALMGEAWRAGKLDNAPDLGRRNGDAYIVSNWTAEKTGAKAVLRGILADVEGLKKSGERHGFGARVNRLERISRMVNRRLEQGNFIASRAEATGVLTTIGSGISRKPASRSECGREVDLSVIQVPQLL